MTSLLLRCIKEGGRVKYLSYLSVNVYEWFLILIEIKVWLDSYNNFILTYLIVIEYILFPS